MSLETVSWSCLLLSLDPNMAAIGFGLAVSGMNLLNVFGMIAIGEIQDRTKNIDHGYYYSQIFLTGVTAVAILIGIIALIYDQLRGKILSTPSDEDSDTNTEAPNSAFSLLNEERAGKKSFASAGYL